jgi:hypothetical protein
MYEHGSLPRARKDGLLEEEIGEELLLYDRESHIAHCLSPIVANVWRHCDGEHDATELAELAGVSQNLVLSALHELREKDLLAAEPELTPSTVLGVSRREAISRAARYGAAAAAGSMIVSATAATPAMAESGTKACGGTNPVESCCLCSNVCVQGTTITTQVGCENQCKNVQHTVFVEFKANSNCGG